MQCNKKWKNGEKDGKCRYIFEVMVRVRKRKGMRIRGIVKSEKRAVKGAMKGLTTIRIIKD